MRIPSLLTTITLVVFSLVDSTSACSTSPTYSFSSFVASTPMALRLDQPSSAAPQGKTVFSSGYTDLTKCGSGLTKKEEKEAEEQGSDIPTRCKGYGGYAVDISYSACASNIALERGAESIHLAMQAVGWKQKTVEWRLANGKPFAVIMRVYQYGGTDLCATDGKITGESLLVKGLKGYGHIDAEVNVKGTPDPNVKAREIADKGYR